MFENPSRASFKLVMVHGRRGACHEAPADAVRGNLLKPTVETARAGANREPAAQRSATPDRARRPVEVARRHRAQRRQRQ